MAVMITAIVGTDMQTMRQGRVVITSLLMASLLTADQNVSIELVQGSWVVPERPWSARFSAGITVRTTVCTGGTGQVSKVSK